MNPENAEKYMFRDSSGVECIGSEAFYHMLAQFGASMQYASKEYYFCILILWTCDSSRDIGHYLIRSTHSHILINFCIDL